MDQDRHQRDFCFSLPPVEKLSALLRKKGSDSLLWYAWRNVLRALPALGVLSSKEINFEPLGVSHYYQLSRFAINLSLWPENKNNVIDYSAVYEACEVLSYIASNTSKKYNSQYDGKTKEGRIAIDKAELSGFAKSALEAFSDTLKATIEILKIVQHDQKDTQILLGLVEKTASRSAYSELCVNALNICLDEVSSKNYEDELSFSPADMYARKFIDSMRDQQHMCINEASARADFKWLEGEVFYFKGKLETTRLPSQFTNNVERIDSDSLIKPKVWSQHPLYSLEYIKEYGKRENVIEITNALLNRLVALDLKFLSDDLRFLLKGNKLGNHAHKYLNEYSSPDTNDASSLRNLILEDAETVKIQAARALVIGPGGAGKSSLSALLQGKKNEKFHYPTMGIDYIDSSAIDFKSTHPELSLNHGYSELFLWDFGGQVILHGLHSTFFHENCLYVLVVDSRHEQSPDDWLYKIQHAVGFQAKVLLVTNTYDRCIRKQNENRLLRTFPSLLSQDSFFYFPCIDQSSYMDRGNKSLELFIKELIKASQSKQQQLLVDTLRIQSILEDAYKSQIFVDIEELEKTININTSTSESNEDLLDKLEQLGFIIPTDNDKTVYCLDPFWLISKSYLLVTSPSVSESKGLISMKEMRLKLGNNLGLQNLKNIINFLQKKGLCKRLNSDDGYYFFPESASENEPSHRIKDFITEDSLTFRFDLQYLPMGFHKELVHELFRANDRVGITSYEDIWREGFIFRSDRSQALVQYYVRKSMIEVIFYGDIRGYSELLGIFYEKINKIMISSSGTSERLYLSLHDEGNIISSNSTEDLVVFLNSINSFKELHKKVRSMASKKTEHNYNITGDGTTVAHDNVNTTFTTNIDKRAIAITTDQEEQLRGVVAALLDNAGKLSPDELSAVAKINNALESNSVTSEQSSLIKNLWDGINDTVGLANNATQLADWVRENWIPITSLLTTLATKV